ncbi:MAG: hypothetical protein ABEJ89_07350 [Haloarculaceae archaeon]
MRYKVVPEARSVAFLREARAAVPLVPGTVEDCCARIRDRTAVQSRDEARAYLTLLEALDLVAADERGYYRTRETHDDAALAAAFRERVFGARELLAAMADGPLTPPAAFERLRESIPRWERHHHTDWEAEWRERTRRLLDWLVAFGLAERDGDRYRAA